MLAAKLTAGTAAILDTGTAVVVRVGAARTALMLLLLLLLLATTMAAAGAASVSALELAAAELAVMPDMEAPCNRKKYEVAWWRTWSAVRPPPTKRAIESHSEPVLPPPNLPGNQTKQSVTTNSSSVAKVEWVAASYFSSPCRNRLCSASLQRGDVEA